MFKKILLYISFAFILPLSAQTNFEQKWKVVDSLENDKDYVKSLVPYVREIYTEAKAQKDAPNKIKALLYLSRIKWLTSDFNLKNPIDKQFDIVQIFQDEIKQSSGVEKSVLQYYLARIYRTYAGIRAYANEDATPTQTKPKDYQLWTSKIFNEEINQLYKQSLENEKSLKNESISAWTPIINNKEYANFRPTLYDIIAADYIAEVENYASGKRDSITNITNQYRQNLVDFHKNDSNKIAYLYAKRNLINYVSVQDYTEKLLALADEFPEEPYTNYFRNEAAETWKNHDTINNYKTAHAICTKAIDLHPNSDWSSPCKGLINTIETQEVYLTTFNRAIPNEYIPIKVSHRNQDKIHLNITKKTGYIDFNKKQDVDNLSIDEIEVYKENSLLEEKLYQEEDFQLKTFDDFKEHETLVALNPLPEGIYTIEATDFDYSIDLMVSKLFYVIRSEDYKSVHLQLLDTKTGEAIKNTAYKIYQDETYNDNGKKSKKKKEDEPDWMKVIYQGTTDSNGMLIINKKEDFEYNECIIYLPKSDQYIGLDEDYDNTEKEDYEEDEDTDEPDKQEGIIVFTDRAIYRPSQKVYFKGILKQEYYEQTKVIPNTKVTATLYNVNREKVTELELISNEYGSVFGEFTLPSNGLTGSYSISIVSSDKNNLYRGDNSFSVEEYKRPKFEVVFDEVKEEYKLNQKVEIKGKAEAFSGAPIGGATVSYNVERNPIYIWRYYGYYWNNKQNGETITHGELTTDADGKFTIPFTSIPADEKSKYKRSYTYKITVTVTDVNGETHDKETSVVIGDLTRRINLDVANQSLQSDFKELNVKATNLNNVKVNGKGTLTITKLKAPERIVKPQQLNENYSRRYYYNYTDTDKDNEYQLYDYDLFTTYFPHLQYSKDEFNPERLKKISIVYQQPFDTEKSEKYNLKDKLEAGYYLVEARSVIDKDTIQDYKIIQIMDDKTYKSVNNLYFAISTEKGTYHVGEKATIYFLSDFPEGYVNYRWQRNNTFTPYQQIALKNGRASVDITITDTDLKKGLFLTYDFVHDNDFVESVRQIKVEEKVSRKLEITTKTFRNKIQPGQPEQWELTIKGDGKEKITAEVLASMYDASLDEFAKNSFIFDAYSPYHTQKYEDLEGLELSRLTETNNIRWDYNPNRFSPDEFRYKTISFPYFALFDFARYGFEKYYYDYDTKEVLVTGYKSVRKFESTAASTRVVYDQISVALQGKASGFMIRGAASVSTESEPLYVIDGVIGAAKNIDANEIAEMTVLKDASATAIYGSRGANGVIIITTKKAKEQEELAKLKARTNLKETAFFFPNLYTDNEGNVKLSFDSPEALTKWKLLVFAHTKDLKTGSAEFITQTQKELMVTPNAPRFLRHGDEVVISTKINNLSDKDIKGSAQLFLMDAETQQPLDSAFFNQNANKQITLSAKGNTEVSWSLKVPYKLNAITYKIVAKAGDFSDGEESALPVLANRMLVTETLPISIKEGENKTYRFDKLIDHSSLSMINNNLSLELTANPTWFAVMSLPYLREFPHECSEQLFSRLYGNMLSTYIMNSSPKIKKVFDEFNDKETPNNPLEENEELKSILLEETPWLNQAKDNDEQMKKLAVFFKLNRMRRDLDKAQHKLVKRQNSNGSFSWFDGGSDDKYISGHILAGFGKLAKMLGKDKDQYFTHEINRVIDNTINYEDKENLEYLINLRRTRPKEKIYPEMFTQYFYARSYWLDKKPIPQSFKPLLDEMVANQMLEFKKYDLQRQAMAATYFERYGYHKEAERIVHYLKEQSVESDEIGMYWKNNQSGWYWYQAPVETQAMLIEAFAEVTPDDVKSVEEMKIWLLKNKQTEAWQTTKATTEAVYALMNYGKSWLDAEKGVTVNFGNTTVYPAKNISKASEAGFVKESIKGVHVKPEMGEVTVNKTSPGVAWGGLYWQYYENLNQIKQDTVSVKLEKKLYKKIHTDKGDELQEITADKPLKVGDRVTVRLVIKTDKDMEYIHLKDMRASGFEPVNVLSSYKWQNGVGYYESTRDAATNFFFSSLRKGIYIFEYDVRANNAGDFSNGITTFQNMYAPEMSAHSEGIRVRIEK